MRASTINEDGTVSIVERTDGPYSCSDPIDRDLIVLAPDDVQAISEDVQSVATVTANSSAKGGLTTAPITEAPVESVEVQEAPAIVTDAPVSPSEKSEPATVENAAAVDMPAVEATVEKVADDKATDEKEQG